MSDPRETELLRQIEERDARLKQLEQERGLLQQRIDQLLRQIYGARSEKVNPDQMQLLLQGLHTPGPGEGKGSSPEAAEAPAPRPRAAALRRSQRTERRLPEHLPVIEEVIVPLAVQAEPEAWRRMGEEVTERLDFEPARFFRRRIVRPKYVHREQIDAVPITAPLPPCILERSIATPGLVAQILVAKYVDHLPLYRQQAIYRSRHGVELSRQNMGQWVDVAAGWLKPIYLQIHAEVMSQSYVQIDETPARYLAPGHGKTKTGYFWTVHRPGADVVFNWQTSRAASCLETIVPADFSGVIQCDGYAGYDAFVRHHRGEIELVGCWAHTRRKFFEAREHAPKQAALILHLIKNLYRTEARLRQSRASPKLRALARMIESRPVIERLRRTLLHWKERKRFLPQSLMGKAIDYALGQWTSLLPYLENGRLEIDTNLVENAIRPTAIGKNYVEVAVMRRWFEAAANLLPGVQLNLRITTGSSRSARAGPRRGSEAVSSWVRTRIRGFGVSYPGRPRRRGGWCLGFRGPARARSLRVRHRLATDASPWCAEKYEGRCVCLGATALLGMLGGGGAAVARRHRNG
jgi:transposase